ncbi:MAG: hypothetical protein LR008_00645 [Candidatus Pacebacteria bacterium]|nr:hypothetical protein [Candidatus Paceibacterota bacterium]
MEEKAIKERLDKLSENYAAFVQSNFIDSLSSSLGKEAGLDSPKTISLNHGIRNYLLFELNFSGLVSHIEKGCTLPKKTAGVLAGAVLAALPDVFYSKQNEMYEEFNLGLSTSEVPAEVVVGIPSAPVPKPTPHIRTMAQDISKSQAPDDPVYTSTQSAILKEKTSL